MEKLTEINTYKNDGIFHISDQIKVQGYCSSFNEGSLKITPDTEFVKLTWT